MIDQIRLQRHDTVSMSVQNNFRSFLLIVKMLNSHSLVDYGVSIPCDIYLALQIFSRNQLFK